jgi:hypothetical protein
LKIIDTEPVLTVKKRNPNSTLKAEDKKQAHEFLLGLEQQLNSALPSTTNVRQIVTKNGQDAKTDDARSHVRWGEDAFIDYFVVPTLFQVIQSAASLSEEDARHSLLSEHYRKIPQSKGTPARKELHPFTKVIGESPEAIMARWERVGGRPLKQACPDLALRAPFPHKIVFEAKYFIQTTLAAAENALVTDVFQTFFYRGLPMDDSRPSGPVWDYDYGCLLAYDGSDKAI